MTVGDRSADDVFREYIAANTFTETTQKFRELCACLKVDPTNYRTFYQDLKSRLHTKEADTLWKLLDTRAAHADYIGGKVCTDARVLVIGGGPCGLRMAIEAALLGSKVVVLEMRDYIARNNVLYLWQFAIQDIKAIGGKVFYPQFCTGAVHHVSIRRLQLMVLKTALVLGVEVHAPVKFERMAPPDPKEGTSWCVEVTPANHPVNYQEFNVVVGADGKRNCLKEFTRKCMRGKLSIAITVNFKNNHTRADATPQEIPGVINLKRPDLFNALREDTRLDFENLVYFKDETHYFVMTAKKKGLLETGILKRDSADTRVLLSADNVDRERLLTASRQVALTAWRVDNPMADKFPAAEFVTNHHNEEDVAIFDFAALHQAEFSCYAKERHGQKLLHCIVGDSLLEPFWPSGSGIARGFLGVLDAAWLIRNWFKGGRSDLELLAERESVFRVLSQTMPEHIQKSSNCIDPRTRYETRYGARLRMDLIKAESVKHLYNTSDQATESERNGSPTRLPETSKQKYRGGSIDPHRLLAWYKQQLAPFSDVIEVTDLSRSWRNGLAFCALLQIHRPQLVDVRKLNKSDLKHNIQFAFEHIEDEFGVLPMLTVANMVENAKPDRLAMLSYLAYLHEALASDIRSKVRKRDATDQAPVSPVLGGEATSAYTMLKRMTSSQALIKSLKQNETMLNMTLDRRRTKNPAQRQVMIDACAHTMSLDRRALRKLKTLKRSLTQGGFDANWSDQSSSRGAVGPPKPKRRLAKKRSTKQVRFQQPPDEKSACDNIDTPEPEKLVDPETKAKMTKMQSLSRMACDGVAANRIQKFQVKDADSPDPSTTPGSPLKRNRAFRVADKNKRESSPTRETRPPSVSAMTAKLEDDCQMKGHPSFEDICCICKKVLYLAEKHPAHGRFFHRSCFRCHTCNTFLRVGNSVMLKDKDGNDIFTCQAHAHMEGAFDVNWEKDTKKENLSMDGVAGNLDNMAPLTEQELQWLDSDDEEGDEEDEEEDEDNLEENDGATAVYNEDTHIPEEVTSQSPEDPEHSASCSTEELHEDETSLSLLMQDEIQQGLEDVEKEQEELEQRGLEIERNIRGEEPSDQAGLSEDELMKEWLDICRQKKETFDKESRIMLQVKLMELQERQMRLNLLLRMMDSTDQGAEAIDEEVEEIDRETGNLEKEISTDDLVDLVQQLQDIQLCLKKNTPAILETAV